MQSGICRRAIPLAKSSSPSRAAADLGGAFTPLYQRLLELGVAARLVDIGKIGPRGRSADFEVDDPGQFIDALKGSGRCCTDTPVGRILHPGKISIREDRFSQSLHVAMDANGHVLAHLDRLSPVRAGRRGETCRYSPWRVVVHNAARLWGDLFRHLFGHRLDCAPLLLSLREVQAEGHDQRDASLRSSLPDPGAVANEPRQRQPRPRRGATRSLPPEPPRLPFSLVDEAVHVLESAAEPWSVHLEARFPASLDEDRLRSAIRAALARHPLARARRIPGGRSARSFTWEIPSEADLDPLRTATVPGDGSLEVLRSGFLSRRVPLAESPPLRVLLVHDPSGDVLVLNVNHSASDVTGAVRLLRSIARAYAGAADPMPEFDPLAVRDVGDLLRARDVPARARRLLLLAEKAKDLAAVPARLAPDGALDAPGYGVHLVRASEALSRCLLQAGGETDVEDVLVATLHLAIALWNIEHGVHCGRISVLVPVNVRPAAWKREVVGNYTLLTRVLTTPEQRSLGHVLTWVAEQTERMRREDTLAAFIELLARTASLPVWAKRATPALLAVTGNRLVDTAELAYLGGLDEPPDFGPDAGPIQELWYSPPARMPLGLSVGAVVAAGNLHLAFRYRPALLNEQAASRFADYYLSLLGQLLD